MNPSFRTRKQMRQDVAELSSKLAVLGTVTAVQADGSGRYTLSSPEFFLGDLKGQEITLGGQSARIESEDSDAGTISVSLPVEPTQEDFEIWRGDIRLSKVNGLISQALRRLESLGYTQEETFDAYTYIERNPTSLIPDNISHIVNVERYVDEWGSSPYTAFQIKDEDLTFVDAVLIKSPVLYELRLNVDTSEATSFLSVTSKVTLSNFVPDTLFFRVIAEKDCTLEAVTGGVVHSLDLRANSSQVFKVVNPVFVESENNPTKDFTIVFQTTGELDANIVIDRSLRVTTDIDRTCHSISDRLWDVVRERRALRVVQGDFGVNWLKVRGLRPSAVLEDDESVVEAPPSMMAKLVAEMLLETNLPPRPKDAAGEFQQLVVFESQVQSTLNKLVSFHPSAIYVGASSPTSAYHHAGAPVVPPPLVTVLTVGYGLSLTDVASGVKQGDIIKQAPSGTVIVEGVITLDETASHIYFTWDKPSAELKTVRIDGIYTASAFTIDQLGRTAIALNLQSSTSTDSQSHFALEFEVII